jgi:hypothetical protein
MLFTLKELFVYLADATLRIPELQKALVFKDMATKLSNKVSPDDLRKVLVEFGYTFGTEETGTCAICGQYTTNAWLPCSLFKCNNDLRKLESNKIVDGFSRNYEKMCGSILNHEDE